MPGIRRYNQGYHAVGIITDDESEDLAFCEVCQRNGELSKLKERIYLDANGKRIHTPPPDADSFRQCWTCGTVVKLRDVKLSGTITGITGIDIVKNPYDYGRSMILAIDDKHRYQRLKKRQNKHPDSEVQRMLEDGYELKSYQQDIPT